MTTPMISAALRKAKSIMFKTVPMMINCREFEDFLVDYFEGTLPRRQRRVFELHLKICRECRDYLAAFRCTIEVSRCAFTDGGAPVPEEVPDDLVRAILDARNT